MNPGLSASTVLLLLLMLASSLALAKSSDRNQPMYLDSDAQDGNMSGDGVSIWTGNVLVKQGTIDIRAGRLELTQRNGDPVRAVFTGKQVSLKQQMDDGSPIEMSADKVDYNLVTEEIELTGNYTVKSPRGTNSGQRMVYNVNTGNVKSGGDGTRVRTVIQPKAAGPQGKN
jgi:lipopolysaccharide export system protein LptA